MNETPEISESGRFFAEKIIAGEFKCVALVMLDENDDIHTWYSGGYVAALGLLRHGEKGLYDREREKSDE